MDRIKTKIGRKIAFILTLYYFKTLAHIAFRGFLTSRSIFVEKS